MNYKLISSVIIILLVGLVLHQQRGINDLHSEIEKSKERVKYHQHEIKGLEVNLKILQAGYIEFEALSRYYESKIDSLHRVPRGVFVQRYDTVGASKLTRHLVGRYTSD